MLERINNSALVERLLTEFPIAALLGPRQVGKTTLAGHIAALWRARNEPVTTFDLEDPTDHDRLRDGKLALEPLQGLVILDEIQRAPHLFGVLRVLADRRPIPARFLILGSAEPALVRGASESLAGRVGFHNLHPFDLGEVDTTAWRQLWHRGGLPRSFLADSDAASWRWRQAFTRTYLERDLGELGIRITSATIRRFWTMLAHSHGRIWNGSELGQAFGVTHNTVRRYLDILCGTFMARRLQPWFENVGKREVRSAKVYLTDSGLLHYLLGLRNDEDVQSHPKVGASFEGFAMQQVAQALGAEPEECFFWQLHSGAELDLLVVRGQHRLGFEFKHAANPRATRSMHIAVETLALQRLDVVYVGDEVFPLGDRIRAVGITRVVDELSKS